MWRPDEAINSEIDVLLESYRASAKKNLRSIVDKYCCSLVTAGAGAEYRKLIELSAKMQMVGHAWTEIAGFPFDLRRQKISSFFGACCFLGDSFLDDYGKAASREYIQRFEVFLRKGWFDIRNDKERVFYIVLCRLFSERDILQPMLRQAICSLFQVQKLDVELSLNVKKFHKLSHLQKLSLLKRCGRDRSGHAITCLALFLIPEFPLPHHHLLFKTGSLISYIDDFGDYYFDLALKKMTYMNCIRHPAKVLAGIFQETTSLLDRQLRNSHGRQLLKGFLYRYFTTRLRKHQNEKVRRDSTRPVYE
jgi:hypothetical protein